MTEDTPAPDFNRSLQLNSPQGRISLTYREAIMLADRLTSSGDLVGSQLIVSQLEGLFPTDTAPAVLRLHNLVLSREPAATVALARRVAQTDAGNPTALALCVRAFRQAGELEPALELALACSRRFPDFAVARHELGLCQLSAGNQDAAIEAFNESIRLAPRYIPPYWSRARLLGGKLTAAQREQLAALAQDPGVAAEDRATLLFALAWADTDMNTDRHFALLDQANSIVAALRPWDEAGQQEKLSRTRARFDRPSLSDRRTVHALKAQPIFVVGMPRAGTSLVEQILSAHPAVTGCGETGGLEKAVHETAAEAGLSADISTWQHGPNLHQVLNEMDHRYQQHLEFYAIKTPFFTEKGLATEWLLGLLLPMYPQARVVYCRRDPLDICLSLYRLHFTSGQEFSYRLAWCARACQLHSALMAHWQTLFPERIFEVHYEQLVANQRAVTANLLSFAGLSWQDSCLEFHRQVRPARTASDFQIKQPLFTSAAGRWQSCAKYLREAADILARHID